MFSQNKPRLYIVYYRRGTPGTYHVALVHAPKRPAAWDPAPDPDPEHKSVGDCVQYHITNLPSPDEPTGERWRYETPAVFLRTERVVAALLLGKPADRGRAALAASLRGVPVVQGDRNFRCKNWVWLAIDKLVADGILGPLPGSGQQLFQVGLDLANSVVQASSWDKPLPMCDVDGNRIQ
ncbi:NADH dehydrogenase [Mycena indigotica]|uniref:NADH dehydrogenase n=1 Tax=Mycena indigotica TaxID=2126181 RepID=A0A8H6VUT0_9AGAR|nr:NADH dehydrogenase [Mycena indigotica]KAF7292741.1 NADH dehydrogenase [Mycena indigotica]